MISSPERGNVPRWPPAGVTWPVPGVVATEQLGTTGPELPPQT
ncbi:hypothetical protein [Umezawaea sp.]